MANITGRVHGGAQVAPCGAVRPSARVRALHGQPEDLPVLSRARPALGDATVGVGDLVLRMKE